MPEMGRIVPELNKKQFRELLFGNYRIIYRHRNVEDIHSHHPPWQANFAHKGDRIIADLSPVYATEQ